MRQKLGKHLFDRLVSAACCKITFWEAALLKKRGASHNYVSALVANHVPSVSSANKAKKIKAEDSAPFWLIEEQLISKANNG